MSFFHVQVGAETDKNVLYVKCFLLSPLLPLLTIKIIGFLAKGKSLKLYRIPSQESWAC